MTIKTRWDDFQPSIFATMSGLAQQNQAINLAQGFPDFDGPSEAIQGAVHALHSGQNQYAPSQGVLELRRLISQSYRKHYDLSYESQNIGVFSGATEAIWCCLLGLLNQGDKVMTFEPFYDSYLGAIHAAYGHLVSMPLQPGDWSFDREKFEKIVSQGVRIFILNTPHNPTGKVFNQDELQFIADCAQRYNFYVLSDEVYEHLTYDGFRHQPMASLPGMWERTITISSTSKTFGMTGWKVGYAATHESILQAMLKVHQFTVFCSATPLQYAMIEAFNIGPEYYDEFRSQYQASRDFLVDGLKSLGWNCQKPSGSYFAIAEVPGLKDDFQYAKELTESAGVACIPMSSFYQEPVRNMLRFSFCKSKQTLENALESLRSYIRT